MESDNAPEILNSKLSTFIRHALISQVQKFVIKENWQGKIRRQYKKKSEICPKFIANKSKYLEITGFYL